MKSEVFAPAKVNLTLHVTGQRADGYHLLDSLVVFVDVADRMSFLPQDQLSLGVTGPFATGVPTDQGNLVWQAAALAGLNAHILLEKNLPHGAGIGSGSADAAAVLRHAGRSEGALSLGADVPVCLEVVPQRMRGIGDQITPLQSLPEGDLVLVNPGVTVPTAAVFKALAQKTNPPMPEDIPEFTSLQAMCDWLNTQRNDLEGPARRMFPQIDVALDALGDAMLARMSGSGATCFGIFEDGAAAANRIQVAHPDWWVATGQMLNFS